MEERAASLGSGYWSVTTTPRSEYSPTLNAWVLPFYGDATIGRNSTGTTTPSATLGVTRSFCGARRVRIRRFPSRTRVNDPRIGDAATGDLHNPWRRPMLLHGPARRRPD